jgi:hypothetical protein
VAVTSAGVVTVTSGGKSYNVNIAGATVGETTFTLSQDSGTGTLLTLGPPTLSFLSPPAAPLAPPAPDIAAPKTLPAPPSVPSGTLSATTRHPTAWASEYAKPYTSTVAATVISHSIF